MYEWAVKRLRKEWSKLNNTSLEKHYILGKRKPPVLANFAEAFSIVGPAPPRRECWFLMEKHV
jgi:hypothetical protein